MPSRDEHLNKATANNAFGAAMAPINSTVLGWTLTVLFYSALHYVEAYNGKFNKHCTNHRDVGDSIKRNDVLRPIYDDYADLQTLSWNARYNAVSYTESQLQEAKDSLAVISSHIKPLL